MSTTGRSSSTAHHLIPDITASNTNLKYLQNSRVVSLVNSHGPSHPGEVELNEQQLRTQLQQANPKSAPPATLKSCPSN
eukprot:1670939-Rhodomonas_salina.4